MTFAVRAHRVGISAAFVRIVAAEDRHVAAAAAGLLDEAAGRGAVLKRRDDLQHDRVDRQQRILEAVLCDVAVLVADGEAHDPGDLGDHRRKLRRDQQICRNRI